MNSTKSKKNCNTTTYKNKAPKDVHILNLSPALLFKSIWNHDIY